MKVLLRPSVLILGTTTALLGGGGMLAYADWSTESDSVAFTVDAARIPRPPRPTVTLPTATTPATADLDAPVVATTTTPRIGWRDVELAGETVHRYVVTRHDGQVTDVVCTVPATRAPSCLDLTAPPATELTYTVAAAHGNWVGLDSAPSRPITTPGAPPVTPSSVPTDSEPSPSATPSAAASPTAGVTTTPPGPPPTTPPGTDVASAEPLIAVAPPTGSEPPVEPFEAVEPSPAPAESLSPSGS